MAKDQKIQFVAYREPALDVGTYKINVQQEVFTESLEISETLQVFGERYALSPSSVHACYPPSGTLGQYQETLPHVSINKKTFPWERSPFYKDKGDGYPWLALLIFDETEFTAEQVIEPEIITVEELLTTTGTAKYPSLTPEDGQEAGDKLMVLDVKKSLLERVIPNGEELRTLAHARRRMDTEAELGVVISNRLPKAGTNSFAHLVSVEGRYNYKLVAEEKRTVSSFSDPVMQQVEGQVKTILNKITGADDVLTFEDFVDEWERTGEPGIKDLDIWNYLLRPAIHWVEAPFDFQGAGPDDFIRLVSLKTWSFASPIRYKLTKKSYQKILDDASISISEEIKIKLEDHLAEGKVHEGETAFRDAMDLLVSDDLPDQEARSRWISQLLPYANYTRSFEQLIEDIDDGPFTLPLLQDSSQEVATFLEKGFTALPHKLRQCDRTYSWYRGPFSPVQQAPRFNTREFENLPDFADSLMQYYADLGMFNASYALAFQLGRMLAVQDKPFATKMSQWKYSFNLKQAKQYAQNEVDTLLGLNHDSEIDARSEETIRQWMLNKIHLEGVPFNYLVPDERFLPEESIRFFLLDRHWIECLQYGAFTIGGAIRTYLSDATEVKDLEWKEFKKFTSIYDTEWTGFLIRSQLVSGWPDLLVEGYKARPSDEQMKEDIDEANDLPLAHRELLGPDVMICLFEGNIETVDLYLKPEGLKFGVDSKEEGGYEKDFQFQPGTIDIPFRNEEHRVVDVKALSALLRSVLNKEVTSAQYAMEMIDGSNKGRFIRKSDN